MTSISRELITIDLKRLTMNRRKKTLNPQHALFLWLAIVNDACATSNFEWDVLHFLRFSSANILQTL